MIPEPLVLEPRQPPPDTPGLGVELDEAVARAHPYEGEDLHLEMQATPVGLDE